MTLEYMNTRDLQYANYRYEHCDGNCEKCPCHNEDHPCYETHEKIRRELNLRGE